LLLILVCFCACRREDPEPLMIKTPDFKKAEAFYDHQNDSAFYYFNKVAGSSKDSLQIAQAYNWMGEIQSDAGDYFGSQESLAISLKFIAEPQKNEYSCLAANYNELGMTSLKLKHYDAAIGFYDQALKFTADSGIRATIRNNQANAYQQKKAYDPAIRLFREAIKLAPPNGKIYARVLTNLAFTEWLKQPAYDPIPEMRKALAIRRKLQDRWGQNGSYAHLSDYYLRSNADSALFYTRALDSIARRLNSADDRLEALQKLILLGNNPKENFQAYQQLNNSVQDVRNAAKNQFALIRYHTEESKAANLKLQKDNAEKKYQLSKLSILLYTLLVALVVVVVWYRKRTQAAVRESELRTSKKVHDVVANGLYRIMTELDHQNDLDKTRLADKIEDLYEKSRDISYEREPFTSGLFHEKITDLVSSFANESLKVALVGNHKDLWRKMSPPAQYDLEHILQELMVNMKKHSQATSVAIRFERGADRIDIHYTDNGIGIMGAVSYKNGLANTVSRINSLQGTITFDTNVQPGLKIHITFPVA
jgi:signal transduction histidine kinase